jgi:salicylate hydroxylase
MTDGRLKVIIAGAGIAGLATAIALRQLAFVDVELYERYAELKEIGASIALSPNVRTFAASITPRLTV